MLGVDTSGLKRKLASGHTSTWLASTITLWCILIILLSWYLVYNENKGTKYILAGILLYEVLP